MQAPRKHAEPKQKGPGKWFRTGLSLAQVCALFPDDEAAERWFAAMRWPDGPACPHCGSATVTSACAHPSMPYRCRDCRKRFSVRSGTVMTDTKLGYRQWALALYLLTTGVKGVSSMKLRRDLGITQKSAWHLAHRIRMVWSGPQQLFAGPVEVDEVYIGGKERNKHESKKLKAGRGPVGKQPVAGARDRASGQVAAAPLAGTAKPDLHGFTGARASTAAKVYTDEASGYVGVPAASHETVNHAAGEYVRGTVHTNSIESFWALFKRGYYGTYHHLSVQHLRRYLDEFAGRHNSRSADTAEQMRRMVRGMVGHRLTWKTLAGTATPA